MWRNVLTQFFWSLLNTYKKTGEKKIASVIKFMILLIIWNIKLMNYMKHKFFVNHYFPNWKEILFFPWSTITAAKTKTFNKSFATISYFFECFKRNLVSPWPNTEYASVLVESTSENFLNLFNNMNPKLQHVWEQKVARIDQHDFQSKLSFSKNANPENRIQGSQFLLRKQKKN